jgi:hypothetical protein
VDFLRPSFALPTKNTDLLENNLNEVEREVALQILNIREQLFMVHCVVLQKFLGILVTSGYTQLFFIFYLDGFYFATTS